MVDPMKPQGSNELTPLAQVEEGYVVLPFSEGQFRDFIKTLLGSPQALTRSFRSEFEVDANALRNVHVLLLQRMRQQNDATLILFRSKVVFSDDSTVEHDSIESLVTYNEVKPVVATQTHLTWDFLVRFPDRSVPEKQRVEISFNIGTAYLPRQGDDRVTSGPRLDIRIEHTARTWAADVEALLTNHVHTLLRKVSVWNRFLWKSGPVLSLSVLAVIGVGTVLWVTNNVDKKERQELESAAEAVRSIPGVDRKIEYLVDLLTQRLWGEPEFPLLLVAFIGVFLLFGTGLLYLSVVSGGETGFLLLSNESRKFQADVLRRRRNEWLKYFLSLVVAIACGIAGNALFAAYLADQFVK